MVKHYVALVMCMAFWGGFITGELSSSKRLKTATGIQVCELVVLPGPMKQMPQKMAISLFLLHTVTKLAVVQVTSRITCNEVK